MSSRERERKREKARESEREREKEKLETSAILRNPGTKINRNKIFVPYRTTLFKFQ